MAAKEKTYRLTAWLAPLLLLLAALPTSGLTRSASETRAWEKSSVLLESRRLESPQLVGLYQPNATSGEIDALGSPLAAESGTSTPGRALRSHGAAPEDVGFPPYLYIGNKLGEAEITQRVQDKLAELGFPRNSLGKYVDIVYSDTAADTGPEIGAANGKYVLRFPKTVKVPDWAVEEELEHLSQFVRDPELGIKGGRKLESRLALIESAQKTIADITNVVDLAAKARQDPSFRDGLRLLIKHHEMEAPAKDAVKRLLGSLYKGDRQTVLKIEKALESTKTDYQRLIDGLKDLASQIGVEISN